jgi:hypothetical protein
MNKPVAAIVYDFDGTLSPGSMQEHSLLSELGFSDGGAFWRQVKDECRERDGDEILTYMQLLMRRAEPGLTREALRRHGAQLPLFDGVAGWFGRLNLYADLLGLALKHFVISSGIREMIEGSSIYENFSGVYASSFAYDESGCACWPSVAINYTTKTQFLFRINKGIPNTWDNDAINRWMEPRDRPVPFERMIFIGDGDTDIPSMKMVRYQGGTAVAVFDRERWQDAVHQDRIQPLIAEDRASYVAPANYTEGSQLDVTVKGVLGRMARIVKD